MCSKKNPTYHIIAAAPENVDKDQPYLSNQSECSWENTYWSFYASTPMYWKSGQSCITHYVYFEVSNGSSTNVVPGQVINVLKVEDIGLRLRCRPK